MNLINTTHMIATKNALNFTLFTFHLLLFTFYFSFLHAQPASPDRTPEIGAQVWIEPGQTPEEIDQWFATLDKHDMRITRIFVMWNFLETAPGQWNFKEYDAAFASAQKHNIKLVATLMPNHGPAFRGFYYKVQDGAIAKTQAQLDESKIFISTIVNRYKNHPALFNWMLMNEPGQMPANDPLAMQRFKDAMSAKYKTIDALNIAWMTGFKSFDDISYTANWAGGGWTWPTAFMDFQNFWREHLTWYLNWVADEIKRQDANHGLHVNPHALIDIPAKYQLPEWKVFLSSLGASIHPVWHFNSLTRSQFPLGVSYVCDLVRGASDPNPFWVTELQGGHNIYSSNVPMVPTPKEIYSWLWTSVGSGAEKTIFWCLNQRSQGTEAGEWGMVDYAGQPTERLTAAGEVAKSVLSLKDFWQNAYPAQPEITLLFSPETVFLQERSAQKDEHSARGKQAHQLSLLSVYQALASSGITPSVKYIYDYEWFTKTAKPRLVVAPHISSLSDQDLLNMKNFVEQGGKLVLTGLSGMFDGYEKTRWMKKSVFDELVGDRVLEVMAQGPKGEVSFSGATGKLASPYFWLKTQKSATPENYPLVHKLGKGEVIWIPAMVDVGNWPTPTLAYQTWWQQLAAPYRTGSYSFGFEAPKPGTNIRVMEGANQYLTVITNTGSNLSNVPLRTPAGVQGTLHFKSNNAVVLSGKNLTLPKGETAVVFWK